MQDLIGYDEIVEDSMRLVIYEALKKIEKSGLPGKHYFVVGFITKFPGVQLSQALVDKHPEEMIIAIQYQFKSILVEHDQFRIVLYFAGKPEKLVIPYRAITSFADPSVNFSLKFNVNYSEDDFQEEPQTSNQANEANIDGSNIISFADFRKPK